MNSEYVDSVITDMGKVYDITTFCTSVICNFENIEISDLMIDDFKLSILYKVCVRTSYFTRSDLFQKKYRKGWNFDCERNKTVYCLYNTHCL